MHNIYCAFEYGCRWREVYIIKILCLSTNIRKYSLSLRFSRHPTNTAVIREVYDGEYSQQCFAAELDHALDAGCMYIIIEPTQLGEETARWIFVGNCLHKIAVISGLGAIAAGNN